MPMTIAAVVPDPYYGLNEGFNQVLDYCTDACGGLLETLERKARQMQKSLEAARAAGTAKARTLRMSLNNEKNRPF